MSFIKYKLKEKKVRMKIKFKKKRTSFQFSIKFVHVPAFEERLAYITPQHALRLFRDFPSILIVQHGIFFNLRD